VLMLKRQDLLTAYLYLNDWMKRIKAAMKYRFAGAIDPGQLVIWSILPTVTSILCAVFSYRMAFLSAKHQCKGIVPRCCYVRCEFLIIVFSTLRCAQSISSTIVHISANSHWSVSHSHSSALRTRSLTKRYMFSRPEDDNLDGI